ncbi:hypothetical protein VTL71DRAFT_5525 [Oculimacula yallundae]|uniref:J domain-containing protein n=1 Tax=Oculimacula yallundae TaxID=86028 RepID=A0ABR4C1D0_9HELO
MDSPGPILTHLTPAEKAEIVEYELIVKFAEEVMAGTHPRIKIPPHLLPTSNPTATATATFTATPTPIPAQSGETLPTVHASRPAIDFERNYYKDLGIQENVKQDSILRAFNSKLNLYGPESAAGYEKLNSDRPHVVKKVKRDFERSKEAYDILSNVALREEYDNGRATDRPPADNGAAARPADRGGRFGCGRLGGRNR